MARQSKLTADEWRVVRRRWEGCDRPGFDWLAKEVHAAYPGINVSRQGVSVRAAREGWEKAGEESKPLALVAQQDESTTDMAEEMADPPAPPRFSRPAHETIASRKQADETGLTPAQVAFALAIGKGLNQSDAYRQAYPKSLEWKPDTVHRAASGLAAKQEVSARIQQLLSSAAAENEADMALVLKHYLARLNADPRELTEIRVAPCRHCYGKGNRYQFTDGELEDARDKHEERRATLMEQNRPDIGPMNEKGGGGYSVLRDPNADCPSCGGAGTNRVMLKDSRKYSPAALALFGGVKQTKEGIEVKLTDRVDVLGHVARHVGFFEADNTPATNVTINMTELDSIYAAALQRSREQEAHARGRMERIANKSQQVKE